MSCCTQLLKSTAIPENLWAEFQSQSLSVLQQLPPDDERLKEIPPQFYAAFPLDSASKTRGTAGSFGYPSETYKVGVRKIYAVSESEHVHVCRRCGFIGLDLFCSDEGDMFFGKCSKWGWVYGGFPFDLAGVVPPPKTTLADPQLRRGWGCRVSPTLLD